MRDVIVVIGIGGMGETSARRQATGRKTILADFNIDAAERLAADMRVEGFDVVAQQVDVGDRASVEALVRFATELGAVREVVHTAGLSPAQASIEAVLRVDLVGVALVLELFGQVIERGGAAVVISSSSAYLARRLTPEQEAIVRTTPTDDLLGLDFLSNESIESAGNAYAVAKRCNQVQVQEASVRWGTRGARVNSLSPGIISTPMAREELAGESGDLMRSMIEHSGSGRIGTTSDIADGIAFLLGPQASLVTGIDLLIDGGIVASMNGGHIPFPEALA